MRVFLRRFRRASIDPGVVSGRDHDVGLRPGDHALHRLGIHRAVERDDPTERGALVAFQRPLVRRGEVVVEADAAGVRVLDDRARRAGAEIVHELPRGVGVVVVEVRERETAVLPHAVPPARCAVPPVARRWLVRILSVSERLVSAVERENDVGRELLARLQPLHDRGVVGRGAGERLERERASCLGTHTAVVGAQLLEQRAVLIGSAHDRDPRVVLGRRARHGRATDVDRLDVGLVEERIQVRDNEIERLDRVRLEVGAVRGLPAVGEQPAVDLRVQRHHSVIEHLRNAGDVVHGGDGDPGCGDGLRCSTRRHELDPEVVQLAREIDEAGLVPHREQRAFDLGVHAGAPRPESGSRFSWTKRSITSG